MTTASIRIEGMSCKHCVMAVKKALAELGVAQADVEIGTASVKYDEKKITLSDMEEAIKKAGYKVVKG